MSDNYDTAPIPERMMHMVPHAAALGLTHVSMSEGRGTMAVAWRGDLVGDPTTEVIASGVVTALLDHTCGMAINAGDEITGVLPFAQHLIGNPVLPALHGGVIGAFMEMTAIARMTLAQPDRRIPKTIDITIEYLRPGRPMDTYARADLRKVGRRVAN